MFWIKFSLLITGFIYAGILPYTLYKSIKSLEFNPHKQTLSFMSIRDLYGEKYSKGYTKLLFLAAILNYFFFWLLIKIYDLGELEHIITQLDYVATCLIILALVPFNIEPYKKEFFKQNVKRVIHNVFAVFVFLSLAALIILFNIALYEKHKSLSIVGFVIISITAIVLFWSILKNKITGFSELTFINGLCIWSVCVTIFTVLK